MAEMGAKPNAPSQRRLNVSSPPRLCENEGKLRDRRTILYLAGITTREATILTPVKHLFRHYQSALVRSSLRV